MSSVVNREKVTEEGQSPELYTIRQLRVMLDLSQADVAMVCGVSRAHYNKIERGSRCMTLRVATEWLKYILAKLDETSVPVDWARVPDFHDIAALNNDLDVWKLFNLMNVRICNV